MTHTERDYEDFLESEMWIYLLGLVTAEEMGEF